MIAAYDDKAFFVSNNMFVLLRRRESSAPVYTLKFILALLNSKLMTAYFRLIQPRAGRLFAELKIEHLNEFPVRRINLADPFDMNMHDDLVALVDRMLELNRRLAPIRNTPSAERDELLGEIERTNAKIDEKVCNLYGLTEEEKQVIKTSLAGKPSRTSGQAKG